MIRRYLGGYKEFICTADKCIDTCCSGWEIVIDDESLDRYEDIDDSLFSNNIDYTEGCFYQRENGDCSFLNENGLCNMILKYGEDILCDTCRLYPRHIEQFYGVREYSLSVSCPEASKQLLMLDRHIDIIEEEDSDEEDDSLFDEFDDGLYDSLLNTRSDMISYIRSSNMKLDDICQKILLDAYTLQNELYEGDNKEYIKKDLISEDIFNYLFELEPLKDTWFDELNDAKKILFKDNTYSLIKDFEDQHPECHIQCENLLIYFLFTYMCGAVYDDYVYAMSAQAVYNTLMIKLLWTARYITLGRKLTIEEQADIVYRYSRELENLTENVICLEQILDENY